MKGMTHTPFAILGVSLLFLLFMTPLSSISEETRQNVKDAEAANFEAKNLENTFKKGLGVTASNYIEAANQHVADNGFVTDANHSINFEEGEFDGEEMSFTTYSEWLSDLDTSYENRGYELEYQFSNLSMKEGLQLTAAADINYEFNHTPSATTYRLNDSIEVLESIKGPDPLISARTGGGFAPDYKYCGFDTPAQQIGIGSESSEEIAHGYAIVQPGELDPQKNEILVVENASQYTAGQLSGFNGVISETQNSVEEGDYAHVTGISDLKISSGDSIIINENEVWNSHFRKIIDDNCYIPTSNGPGLFNRMEGDHSASDHGFATFLNTNISGSDQSNEPYIHYSFYNPSTVEIAGVTSEGYVSDPRTGFEIDQENANEWNIDTLTK